MASRQPDMPTGVTIYKVAQQAGVSIATVSRTLRGTGPVAHATREKVLAAVQELHFKPSRAGVSLAEGRYAANGIIFPNLAGPYYTEVVLGYEEVASELGRSVLILSTKGRTDVRELVQDLAGRVDGMVIFGRAASDELPTELAAAGLPLVLLAREPLPGADTLSSENHHSAGELVRHLLGHGHRSFAFLGAPTVGGDDVEERLRGVQAALDTADVPAAEAIPCPEFTVEGGYDAASKLLQRRTRPDVVVCSDDEVALGTLLAAEELGHDVPGELAVTGWDDIMAARHARPALTTVRQPMRELGASAARALDELIAGARQEPRHLVLPTELVIRASCGTHHRTDQPAH